MMITEKDLQQGVATTRAIWCALFASLLLYVGIAPILFEASRVSFSPESYRTLRLALFGGTVITLAATWLLRKYLLAAPPGKKITHSKQHPAVARYLTVMMVVMGLSESIGIYGLILYMLGKNRQDLYLLTLVSAVAMLLYFPKREEIAALAKRLPPQEREQGRRQKNH